MNSTTQELVPQQLVPQPFQAVAQPEDPIEKEAAQKRLDDMKAENQKWLDEQAKLRVSLNSLGVVSET